VQHVTGNYHLTDFQAALGLSQLKRLKTFQEKRQHLMSLYQKELSLPFLQGLLDKNTFCHIAVALIDFEKSGTTREVVQEALKSQGIGTQVHYIPLNRHPFFTEKRSFVNINLPHTEEYYRKTLTLPLFPDMAEEDVSRVAAALKPLLKS
jgi:dTDP-4-amino-4,6-dideoxygalactose transaminase